MNASLRFGNKGMAWFIAFSVMCCFAKVAAADLTAGSLTFSARADQNVRVTGTNGEPVSPLSGPPFNIPAGTVFNLSALGTLEFTWADEVAGVAELTDFSAEFFENHHFARPLPIGE